MSQLGANVQIYLHYFTDGAHTALLDLEEHFNQDSVSKFGCSDVELDVKIFNNRPTATSPMHTPNQQQHVLLHSQSEVSSKQVFLNGSSPARDEWISDFLIHQQREKKRNGSLTVRVAASRHVCVGKVVPVADT